MKFSGSNFQSWPDFSLEISGLTVVVGPSNKGKSALFRALKGLLRNELSAAYVRNGQKQPLELTVKMGDHVVTATRARDGSSHYVIDGQRFAKLAGAIPEDIKKLGYGEVKIGEFGVDPIFATQNDPQFLLDKKAYGPSLLNAVLGAFGGTEKLEAGKKEANLRITQKNGEAKTHSYEIAETHQRCEVLESLVTAGSQLAVEIHSLESSARHLEARSYWTSVAHHHRNRLAPMLMILKFLEIPDIQEVERLQRQVANLESAGAARSRVEVLKGYEQSLSQINFGWTEIVGMFKKIKALCETSPLVERKSSSTADADARELNDIIGRLEDVQTEVTRLQGSIRYIDQVTQLRTRVTELQHERQHVEAEQNDATKLKCPQCGTEF